MLVEDLKWLNQERS